jgi:hypothetical protein
MPLRIASTLFEHVYKKNSKGRRIARGEGRTEGTGMHKDGE